MNFSQRSLNRAMSQSFNKDYFDRSDPVESIGTQLIPFSFYNVYDVEDPAQLPAICEALYARVQERLNTGQLGDVRYQIMDYQDSKQRNHEHPRKYLVITRETNRKTRITIMARFLPYGNKLYVAIDSYVLGQLNIRGLAIPVIVTALPLTCVAFNILSIPTLESAGYSGYSLGNVFCSVICCYGPWLTLTIPLFWIGVIRNWRQEKNILLSLRQAYNRLISNRSFNIDDVLMTLKSALPVVLYSMRDVFDDFGLPVELLDSFIQNVQTVNNITQNFTGSNYGVVQGSGSATLNTSGPKPG